MIFTSDNDPAGQLYRLDRDPGETTDLSTRYPKVKATMAAELATIRGATKEPDSPPEPSEKRFSPAP